MWIATFVTFGGPDTRSRAQKCGRVRTIQAWKDRQSRPVFEARPGAVSLDEMFAGVFGDALTRILVGKICHAVNTLSLVIAVTTVAMSSRARRRPAAVVANAMVVGVAAMAVTIAGPWVFDSRSFFLLFLVLHAWHLGTFA